MTRIKEEHKYNYKIPILYQAEGEEEEAFNIGVKEVDTSSTVNGRSLLAIGRGRGATDRPGEDSFDKNYASGNYIEWKKLRKYYAQYLDENPFEIGDKVRCIDDTSSRGNKVKGELYTIENLIDDDIQYSNNSSSSYKYFELHLPELDWRDAFIEKLGNRYTKVESSDRKAIRVSREGKCDHPAVLLAYVSSFRAGGFWYEPEGGLDFVLSGSNTLDTATYQHAKQFINDFQSKHKL